MEEFLSRSLLSSHEPRRPAVPFSTLRTRGRRQVRRRIIDCQYPVVCVGWCKVLLPGSSEVPYVLGGNRIHQIPLPGRQLITGASQVGISGVLVCCHIVIWDEPGADRAALTGVIDTGIGVPQLPARRRAHTGRVECSARIAAQLAEVSCAFCRAGNASGLGTGCRLPRTIVVTEEKRFIVAVKFLHERLDPIKIVAISVSMIAGLALSKE